MFTILLLLLHLFIITILLPKTYDCLDSSLFFSLISSISTPISSYHIFSYLFLSFLIYPFPFLFLFSPFYPSLLFFSFLFFSLLFYSFLFFFFFPLPHHSIRILIILIYSLTLNLFRIS